MSRVRQTVQERRKGELALSEFAEYVEKQQAARHAPSAASISKPSTVDEHAELDILDSLNLSDEPINTRLKQFYIDTGPDAHKSLDKLKEAIDNRILEGHGEAMIDLGLEDDGKSMEFSKEEWHVAWSRLVKAAEMLKADCKLLTCRNVGGEEEIGPVSDKDSSCTGKVMIRQHPEAVQECIETRIAVVGNVDAGKSTMLGVLVKGGLDDGRGKARVNLFRHKHEVETGRTSSVGMEIMGFDTKGDIVMSNVPGRSLTWEEIGHRSAKVISFTDLAGHEKYLRTTAFGLMSSSPNYCLLMVAANNGLIGMSKEHLGIALTLNVPVMVVITKIDICPPQILKDTVTQITRTLKSPGARKVPVFIKTREDCVTTASQFVSKRICPIFQVSNVTGESLDLVRMFLNILPHHGHYDATAPFEFQVNDHFSVPFTGCVVSGVVKSGTIHTGDPVLLGPDSLGGFTLTAIKSIHRRRVPVPMCIAGQSASFALKKVRRKDVRKGMVVLPHLEVSPKVYREFVAEVLILSHATTIKVKYQAMLHVGPVSQTCAIIDIDREFMRTGDKATVAFKFIQRPEYLMVGDKILFREGRTKGLGVVKQVGYDYKKPLNPDAGKKRAPDGETNGAAE